MLRYLALTLLAVSSASAFAPLVAPTQRQPTARYSSVPARSVEVPKTHYELLGASPTATHQELRKCYVSLAFKLHPDSAKDVDTSSEFSEVARAWEVLSDPYTRMKYDRKLKAKEVATNIEGAVATFITKAFIPFFRLLGKAFHMLNKGLHKTFAMAATYLKMLIKVKRASQEEETPLNNAVGNPFFLTSITLD